MSLEITHRLHRHDARQLLAAVEPLADTEDLDAIEHRAALALLVSERFALRSPGGQPLLLTLVGAEVEGDYIYVYQESPSAATTALEVQHQVLGGRGITELYQVSEIGKTRLVLEGGERWEPLSSVESAPTAG